MLQLSEVKSIHLELSTFCNARCVSCTRNVGGFNYNTGFEEKHLSLSDIQTILPISFVKQLNKVLYNGNLGDMLMNSDTLNITNWLISVNPNIEIIINTNGGAGNKDLWSGLGQLGIECNFAIDGLADTHHLYRQNTSYDRILKNAKTFIDAGGFAVWKMIEFDHNRHQIEDCKTLAYKLGFKKFKLIRAPFNRGERIAFDEQGNFSHKIEITDPLDCYSPNVYEDIQDRKKSFTKRWNLILADTTTRKIECYAKQNKDIYINAIGEVYPCCYIGFQPRTLDPLYYISNIQIKEMIKYNFNNALHYPLEKCIEWFSVIEETWSGLSIANGGLKACHDNCGKEMSQ